MINWSDLMPEKVGLKSDYCVGYEQAMDDILERLKAAEKLGEICKPLSVERILSIIKQHRTFQITDISQDEWDKDTAFCIHAAMTRRDE